MQPSLPGFGQDRPPQFMPTAPATSAGDPSHRRGSLLGYGLWMALFPSPEDARRIANPGAALRTQHGLTGAPLTPDRLHITLLALAGGVNPPQQIVVDAAMAAAAAIVACAPLTIAFDRVLTFAPSNAFVLRCTAHSDAAIARLRNMLAWTLRRRYLRPTLSGTPHMTLSHGSRYVDETAIAPIRWTATRFALILSHVGTGHHEWIGQWDLRGGNAHCGR
jgi:2'-5' RNA ligase